MIRPVEVRGGRIATSGRRPAPVRCRRGGSGSAAARPRGGNLLVAVLVVASIAAQVGLRSLVRTIVPQPVAVQAAAW